MALALSMLVVNVQLLLVRSGISLLILPRIHLLINQNFLQPVLRFDKELFQLLFTSIKTYLLIKKLYRFSKYLNIYLELSEASQRWNRLFK